VSGSPSASISGSPAASPTPSGSSSPVASSAANLSLLVTGNLAVSNTQLACGGLAVGGQLTGTPTFGQANAPNLSGSAGISSSNINLASLRTQLLASSNELCSLSSTGRLSLNNGIAVFDASASGSSNSTSTSSSTSSLNSTSASVTLFNLTSADLANLTAVRINGTQANGFVIINVIDQSAASSNISTANLTLSGFGTDVGSLNASHLLWNFCNASNIVIDNIMLLGTILAPRSTVNITRAELEGSLIAESLTGNFFNQIPLPFAGNFCPTASASPSPSTSPATSASPATSTSSSPAATPSSI
jgi:choice-of-anchor A domain-containing protein